MVKVKNKRNSNLSDKVQQKKSNAGKKKTLNPFEVHINKEKFRVLGKKTKHDRGLPGVSRAKSIQKRKLTLGVEYKLQNKTNTFLDKRIGEKSKSLSGEDKITARFAAERIKQHAGRTGKKNIFNLADDEILTHRGQTLEEIEKFDDPRSSDDEEDDGRKFGGLKDDFVSEGHFGGGMLSRTDAKDGAKSHKDLIEQLIAESKKRKVEKQKLKEQTLDLTEKLDEQWKDLQPLAFKRMKRDDKEEPSLVDKLIGDKEQRKNEDYDKMMRELKFESRGTPSDGLKSEEKIAKEQKEKLEKLEKERLERMHGNLKSDVISANNKHRSADDLDDNFELDTEPQYMMAYDDHGKPLVPEHILQQNSLKDARELKPNNSEDEDESAEASEEDDDSEGEEADKESNEKETQEEVGEEEEEEEESDNGSSIDSLNDLKEDEDEEINDEDVPEEEEEEKSIDSKSVEVSEAPIVLKVKESLQKTNTIQTRTALQATDSSKMKAIANGSDSLERFITKDDIDKTITEKIKADLLARKAVMEQAMKELPYTYEMPADYEGMKELLNDKLPEYQSVILERLIKCYHQSLAEANKEILNRLFAYLLQYINDLFSVESADQIINSFAILKKISPLIYDLAQMNPLKAKNSISHVLAEKYLEFKKSPKQCPGLENLIFFKMVSLIFPTSDFRHPIVTPCLIFMSDILTKCKFNSASDIAYGLFLTTLILEYTVLSKRFLPTALNFCRGILFMCANTTLVNPIKVITPFKNYGENSKLLILENDCSNLVLKEKQMLATDLVRENVDDDFKVRTLHTCVNMVKEMFTNLLDEDCLECLFKPHIDLMARLDLELYPKSVSEDVSEISSYMKETLEMKTYSPLTTAKKRPKALKLYEPDVQDVFTGQKSRKIPKEKAEHDKLVHKYKKEMKGALREIRRDKAYLGAVKIKQKIQSDNVRKEKVKQIYKDASIQQGELNQIKRQK